MIINHYFDLNIFVTLFIVIVKLDQMTNFLVNLFINLMKIFFNLFIQLTVTFFIFFRVKVCVIVIVCC